MSIAKMLKEKGFTLEEYETFMGNMRTSAEAIVRIIKASKKADTGLYYPVSEILGDEEKRDFITTVALIQELKKLGVEFFDNNTLYRY